MVNSLENLSTKVCTELKTELIYVEKCSTSVGGDNYFVLFRGDSSLFRFVYLIKHKNDPYAKLLGFERMPGNIN